MNEYMKLALLLNYLNHAIMLHKWQSVPVKWAYGYGTHWSMLRTSPTDIAMFRNVAITT